MKSKTLLFVLISYFGLFAEVVSAQTAPTLEIPACVSCLLNKNYLDEEVVDFLQNPALEVWKKEVKGRFDIPIIYWEGKSTDFSFEIKTESKYAIENIFYYQKFIIESISFKAKSSTSSERCFKGLLAHWELTTNPKESEKLLKKGYFRDLNKTKNGDFVELGFLDANSVEVLLIWNVEDNKSPWLEEVRFLLRGKNCNKNCFESKALILSRPQVDLNNGDTYWRALGMVLTESDFKIFKFHNKAWQIDENKIESRDGMYTFNFFNDGNDTRVTEVIYNHEIKNTSSPIAHSNNKTVKQVGYSFGENYNLEDGVQVYARDPSRSESTSFYFDIEFTNDYVSAVYVKAEDLETFDNAMTMKLEDMRYSRNCFDGDCVDKIGSQYYSDGYMFIGQWREHKPDFGFVYNRERIAVDIIENRITTDEAKARDIAKQNADAQSMVSTLELILKNQQAITNNWNAHVKSMEAYFGYYKSGSTEMIGAMTRAVEQLSNCSKNCDALIEQARDLSRIYAKYNFCVENLPLLNRIEKNASQVKKEVNGLLFSMNSAHTAKEYNEIMNGYQKQIETLLMEIQDDYHKIVEQYNACVEAQ